MEIKKMDNQRRNILNIRTPSGLSGDMLLAGLLMLASNGKWQPLIDQGLQQLNWQNDPGLPGYDISITMQSIKVKGIQGINASINLKDQTHHRSYTDIIQIIEQTSFNPKVKDLAKRAFTILAQAEAEVHDKAIEKVTFHEVGALDSIVDIALASFLFVELDSDQLVCSPLPIADGNINMHHGLLFSPAPAVLKMLQGIPVYGVEPEGETVTPTAIAMLLAMGATFGPWPDIRLDASYIIYGNKRYQKLPNGAIFVKGRQTKLLDPGL